MLLPPRFSPLLTGAVCLIALLGISAMFVARLHQIGTHHSDPAPVRAEVRRILENALSARNAVSHVAVAEQDDHQYDDLIETVVAGIGTRMRELGAPLWETQASVLKRALASGDDGDSGPAVIPDEVIGEAAPVLSPRQVQILALVQAESRWAEAMGAEERHGPEGNHSLR